MIDLRANFKFGKSDISCRACHQSEETQEHLLQCLELQENEIAQSVVVYSDLFGNTSEKLAEIAKILNKKIETMKEKEKSHCEHRDGCSTTKNSNTVV